ncbi:MAG: tRNA (adenosine(37)-N6)-threonylcarbamoyltransferase complex ATPase subunit type 1 TsaE [Burkholderiaceae bacterium]|nr:tRNA (adenosine(37)-N6)-threonylcarbamoyltransferase complex ATPase subunit type 1 TsaE [Microbacteriaceae bacterium]
MAGLGRRIARQLRAGDVVALDGELGAGKTTLTRGLGAELGVRGAVTSPTFVLARTHPRPAGGPPLVHVDAYRLGSAAELDDLDIDFAASIVVVEWAAGMLDALTDSVLSVRIDRPTGARLDPPRADVANTGHNDAEAGTGTEITGTAIDDADIDNSEIDDAVEARVVTITPRGERWRRHPFI